MRRLLALSLLVIAAGSGCRMCASPYDYCGPVVDDCCCGSDYQSYTPRHDAPTDEGVVESSEGSVYYEGSKSIPPKTATKVPSRQQTVPAASLPRQARKPTRTRTY